MDRLIRTQNELSQLINQLENKREEGDYFMNNNDFELLKKQEIAENEAKYGKEIRQKYGTTVIDDSNKKYQEQGQNEHDWAKETHSKVVKMLEDAYNTQDNFLPSKPSNSIRLGFNIFGLRRLRLKLICPLSRWTAKMDGSAKITPHTLILYPNIFMN